MPGRCTGNRNFIMESFIKNILLNNIAFRVHFDKINAPNGIKYFVFARDQNGESYSFNMEREDSHWRIVNAPRVNDIFLKNEEKLSDAIKEHSDNRR